MPRVTSNGVSINYRIEGNGPPLILQHGFLESSERWYELGYVGALKEKYRLILPDTRGHGESDKPHDPQAYTAEQFAADIAQCSTTQESGKFERVAGLIGGAAAAGTAFPAEPGKDDPLIDILRRGAGEVMKAYGEWLTPGIGECLRANDATALITCREQRLLMPAFTDIGGNIGVPTLIYAGDADAIHEPAKETASLIPGARFISLPGPGPRRGHVSAAVDPAARSAVSGEGLLTERGVSLHPSRPAISRHPTTTGNLLGVEALDM